EIDALCEGCKTRFRGTPTRSFLGFQKVKCPSCGHETLYPLTKGYRGAYWVILCLMVLVVIENAREGQVTFPGLLGVAVIIAIVRDAQIRRQVSQAATSSNLAPTTSPTITRGRRVNPTLVQALGGLVGFLVASYAVRAGINWYRETT